MEKFTKYEEARLIGARALQISMGAPFMIKLTDEDLKKINYNPVQIAKLEYKEGITPMVVNKANPSLSKKEVIPKVFDQTRIE